MTVVSIGGGEITSDETRAIDEFILTASGRTSPRVLFIPTASRDSEGYCRDFYNLYGERLGCEVSFLLACSDAFDYGLASELIEAADILYVGGGNTRFMIRRWADLGLDVLMKSALASGKVLSGLSAGGICWYAQGLSDSGRFSGSSDWDYCLVDGLNMVPFVFCPHLDVERRHDSLIKAVRESRRTALACDNGAAIVWSGHEATVLSSLPKARAYCYFLHNGSVNVEPLEAGQKIRLEALQALTEQSVQ